jgi:MFS family permease
MVHASLTTGSDFLGYVQPRPKAPFTYANTWGNNVGLTLPFFLYAWLTSRKRWQRYAAPLVVLAAAAPIIFSLNRGLWIGLLFLTVYGGIVLARMGRVGVLWGLVVTLMVAALLLVASPLWDTITLRLETPNSNDRRGTLAEVVTSTTLHGSPLLGYGTTRQLSGSFASVAGGETPNCHQCAAPPLGTQGFFWRLVFTTGFVGTALFFSFLAVQFFGHVRRRDPLSILGCLSIALSVLFFFVYDSLESPLFLMMLAVGLMNVQRYVAVEPSGRLGRQPSLSYGARS